MAAATKAAKPRTISQRRIFSSEWIACICASILDSKRSIGLVEATSRIPPNSVNATVGVSSVLHSSSKMRSSPGGSMAVHTRYAKVTNAEGSPISVREALAMINPILDEVLAEQEGDFDPDSRWALAWFDQFGFSEGEFGIAETLSKAKNTSVQGLVGAGVIVSRGGTVRLLKPSELPSDWDPDTDTRLTAWEAVHHLVRVLEGDGEAAAGTLAAKLGALAETSRELCYRLYIVCERKKRNEEARAYNGLVQSWPEIMRLSRTQMASAQHTFDDLE